MASNNVINYTMRCTADLTNVQTQIQKLSDIKLDFSNKGNYKNTVKEFDLIATSIQNAFKTENLNSSNVSRMFQDLRSGAEHAKSEIKSCKAELEGMYLSRGNQKNLIDLDNIEKKMAAVNKSIKQRDAKYSKGALKQARQDLNVPVEAKDRQKELNLLDKIVKQDKELTKSQQARYDNIIKYNALLTESHKISKGSLLAEKTSLEGDKKRLLSNTVMPDQYQSGMFDVARAETAMNSAMQQINMQSFNAGEGFRKYGEELAEARKQTEKTKKETLSLGSAMTTSMLGFSLTNIVTSTMHEAVAFYKDYDEILTRTMMVTNLSRSEVEGLTDSYRTMATELKTTTKEVAAAQLVFYQQGLTAKASTDMTEASIAISKTGGLEAEEAANRLTAAMRGYKLATSEAMDLADKMSALDAKAASSVDELTTAMQKSASQANMAGLDLDYYMAYLSTMQEVTRESAENIGTAMKSITARMQEITDIGKVEEDGTSYNSVAKALSSVGISAVDSAGQLRSLQEIMTELGPMWDTLDRNQQAYIATTLAGNRQQSRFIALMDNYDRAMELVSVSQNAAGETAKQLRDYDSGLESSLIALTQAWETMATKVGETSFIKGLVDSITSLVELINKNDFLLKLATLGAGAVAAKKALDVAKVVKETNIGQALTKPLLGDLRKTPEEKQGKLYDNIGKEFTKMYKKDNAQAMGYYEEAIQKTKTSKEKYKELKTKEGSDNKEILLAEKELKINERILAVVEDIVSQEDKNKVTKEREKPSKEEDKEVEQETQKEVAKPSKKEDKKTEQKTQAKVVKQNKKDIKAEKDAAENDAPNVAEKETSENTERTANAIEQIANNNEQKKLGVKDKGVSDTNKSEFKGAPHAMPDYKAVPDKTTQSDKTNQGLIESMAKQKVKEQELATTIDISKVNITDSVQITKNGKSQSKIVTTLKKQVALLKEKFTVQGKLNAATAKAGEGALVPNDNKLDDTLNKVTQAAMGAAMYGTLTSAGLKALFGEMDKVGDGFDVTTEYITDAGAEMTGLGIGTAYFAKQLKLSTKQSGYLIAAVVAVRAVMYAWNKAAEEAKIAIERVGEAMDNWSAATEQVTVMDTLLDTYDSLIGKIIKSTAEQEELNNAVAELAALAPEAIIGYDADGNAILDNAKLEIVLDEKKSEENEAATDALKAAAVSAKKTAEKNATTTNEQLAEAAVVGVSAVGGAVAGAKIGAAIGTAIAPGVGTAIGVALGAVVGLVTVNIADSLQQTEAEYRAFILEMTKISGEVVKAALERNEYVISSGTEENQQARTALASNLIHSSYQGFVTSGRVTQNMSDKEIEKAMETFNEEVAKAFNKIEISGGLDVLLAQVELANDQIMKGETWASVGEDFKGKLREMLENMNVPDEYIDSFVNGLVTQIFAGMTNPETIKNQLKTLEDNAKTKGYTGAVEVYEDASKNIDNSSQATLNAMSAAGLYDNLDDVNAGIFLNKIYKDIEKINEAGKNADGTLNQTGASFALATTLLEKMGSGVTTGKDEWDRYTTALNNVLNTMDGPVVESFSEMANTVSGAVSNVHSLLDVMSDLSENTQIDVGNFTTVLNILDEMQTHMEDGLLTAGSYSAALSSMVDGTSVVNGALNMEADALLALAEIEREVFVAKMEMQKAEISIALEQARFEKKIIEAQIQALIEGLSTTGTIKEKEQKMRKVFNSNMKEYNAQWLNSEATTMANYVAVTEAAVAQAGSAWGKLQKAMATGDFSELEGFGADAETVLKGLTANLAEDTFNFSDSFKTDDDWKAAVEAQKASLEELLADKNKEITGLEDQYKLYEMLIEVGGDLSGLDAFGGSSASASEYNEVLEETLTLLEKIAGLMHTMEENSAFMSLYEGYDGDAYGRLLATNLSLAKEQYEVYEALFEMQQRHVNQAAGDLLDSSYGYMFNIDENGDIGWSSDDMYDLYKAMPDSMQEDIDGLVQAFQEQRDELRSTEQDMIAYAEAVKSAREELIAMELEVENALVEAIKNREQILHDARMKAIDDEVAAIEEAMEARTAAREDENSEKELYEAQEALRRATLDSSGKNNASLLQLQEELENKQLEISEKRFEDDMNERLEWLQDTKDAETETYEYRLETMTWYWEQVAALQEAGNEAMILALISWNEEYRTASALHQSEMEREWTFTMDAMKAATDMGLELGQLTDEIVSTTATIESMNIKVDALAGSWSSAASAINSATSALNSYNSIKNNTGQNIIVDETDDLKAGEKDDMAYTETYGPAFNGFQATNLLNQSYSAYTKSGTMFTPTLNKLGTTVRLKDNVQDGTLDGFPMYETVSGKYIKIANKSEISAYREGGMVDYTGPAWVDGTPSKPEAFLNPYQTEQIGALANALDSSTVSSASSSNSITFENITFEVGSMSSPEDGKSALDAFVQGANDLMSKRGIGTTLNLNLK